LKRFNVSIYFRLRQQQIVAQLEAECGKVLKSKDKERERALVLVGATTRSCLLRCWARDVWLAELSASFLKLTAQLVERYIAFAKSIATDNSEATVLIVVRVESRRILRWIQHDLAIAISSIASIDALILIEAFRESFDSLLPSIDEALRGSLSSPLLATLSSVSRLSSVYRMTQKQPTAPSAYLLSACRLMRQYRSLLLPDGPNAIDELESWPLSERDVLMRSVMSSFVETYSKEMTHVVEMTLKTEASLKLLKRSRNNVSSSSISSASSADSQSEMSDSDRVRAQLLLDVAELDREAKEMELEIDCRPLHNALLVSSSSSSTVAD